MEATKNLVEFTVKEKSNSIGELLQILNKRSKFTAIEFTEEELSDVLNVLIKENKIKKTGNNYHA